MYRESKEPSLRAQDLNVIDTCIKHEKMSLIRDALGTAIKRTHLIFISCFRSMKSLYTLLHAQHEKPETHLNLREKCSAFLTRSAPSPLKSVEL